MQNQSKIHTKNIKNYLNPLCWEKRGYFRPLFPTTFIQHNNILEKRRSVEELCWSSSCYHFYHKTYFSHFFWILSKTHISFLKSKIHRGWIQNWKIRRSVEELFVGHPAATTSVTKHIFRPILLNLVHNVKVDLPSKIGKAEKY